MANRKTKIKKYKRRYAICTSLILLINSSILYFLFSCANESNNCKEKTMHTYITNLDVLNSISKFMENNDFKSMYIDSDEIEKGILTHDLYKGNVYISITPKMEKLIQDLHLKSISKEGNSIYFLVETWMSTGYGLAYSLDGNKPNSIFIEKTEYLGNNWYYYEAH